MKCRVLPPVVALLPNLEYTNMYGSYRTKKTVENPDSFYLDIGLTNTGCTAQLTIPSAVNDSGNFFLII